MTPHAQFHIETIGCQMNKLDTELVATVLCRHGYRRTDDRADADLVLINTCSVRAHAEQKVYSHLSELVRVKKQRPQLVIAVLGCMAQRDPGSIFEQAPHVDIVCGPGRLGELPDLIRRVHADRRPVTAVSLDRHSASTADVRNSFVPFQPTRSDAGRAHRFMAYVRIMTGCNRFCSYCVVPTVRGPEQSRPPDAILAEVRQLADQGCRQVTLLGQTVNGYRHKAGPGTTTRLADLLERVHAIHGIDRIKFITNFPRYMTPDLIQAVRDLPKVCPYFHVPAQSGSDAVLRRMRRRYTATQYRDMVARLREAIPRAAISSDFIVGFPGETHQCFEQTVALVRETRFKNSFIFGYSPRPGTRASHLDDDVPLAEKRRRNQVLLEVQDAVAAVDNRRFVGHTVEVLVEGPSKHEARCPDPGPIRQLAGRTPSDHIVVFDGPPTLAGQIVPVHIQDATALTLFGVLDPPSSA